MVSSQVLPQTDIPLVQLLADVALNHPLFEVDHLVVALGAAKQGKGLSAQEAFSCLVANLGHSITGRQFCNKTKNSELVGLYFGMIMFWSIFFVTP